MKFKNFNLIITGYGGQGILTLAEIISKASFLQKYDVKETEIHGLAQRGGSLIVHIRLNSKIFSPLIMKGQANLIIALDSLEALRACYFANKKTIFLVNKKLSDGSSKVCRTLSRLKGYGKIHLVNADEISEKLTGKINYANTYILAYAVSKKLLPLNKKSLWEALKEKIKPQFIEDNKKVFDYAFRSSSFS